MAKALKKGDPTKAPRPKLVIRSPKPQTLVQFFRGSPLVGVRLDFDRDSDTGRDIEL